MSKLTPEELLEKVEVEIQQEQTENTRGKLKIFLGYCAGVGKTFHMLDIATDMKKAGKDIVIGYVERHDRKETLDLLEGMEILKTKQVVYKNIVLQELDVQEVLNRSPEIVIIDEYAHTNVNGSKNEKRYQDIKEILENGIDVYTTLNIQHIESLNETVKKITKIKVKEIIPDKYVEMADNIELIDIEPKELLNRIHSGKVYQKEQIEKAVENFFTIENLTKLREIALKYMINSVDRKSFNTIKERLLVLVESPYTSQKQIKRAYEIAHYLHCNWTVLFILKEKQITKEQEKQMEIQIKEIKKWGGMVEKKSGKFGIHNIKEYVQQKDFTKIIMSKDLIVKKIFRFYFWIKAIDSCEIFIL